MNDPKNKKRITSVISKGIPEKKVILCGTPEL